MKLYFPAIALIVTVFIFSYCSSSKKARTSATKQVYANSIETLMLANCSPCHIPAKGGNKKALDSYESVKAEIDDIIKRIELNPADRGFMPFRKPKLNDSTIAVFKKWKADGLVAN